MVRGICTNLCYPFGYHASMGFTGDQLHPLVWEATRVLETIGFKVRAWVADGASPNRKLFKMNVAEDTDNWLWNYFANGRKIYTISDFLHLIKTTRNCLENSHGNLNTRNLKVRYFFLKFCSQSSIICQINFCNFLVNVLETIEKSLPKLTSN